LIISIIPEYMEDLGDCCRVLDSEGERFYKKRIQSIIKELYREKFIDFEGVKSRVSKILNQKNLNPLYIGRWEVLIPIKVRSPRILKDGTYGYINVFEINRIVDKQIYLKGGKKIDFFDTKRIVSRRVKLAKGLSESFSGDINPYVSKNLYDPGIMCLIEYMFKEIGNIKIMIEKYMKPSLGL
jgi:hypothetical protein